MAESPIALDAFPSVRPIKAQTNATALVIAVIMREKIPTPRDLDLLGAGEVRAAMVLG